MECSVICSGINRKDKTAQLEKGESYASAHPSRAKSFKNQFARVQGRAAEPKSRPTPGDIPRQTDKKPAPQTGYTAVSIDGEKDRKAFAKAENIGSPDLELSAAMGAAPNGANTAAKMPEEAELPPAWPIGFVILPDADTSVSGEPARSVPPVAAGAVSGNDISGQSPQTDSAGQSTGTVGPESGLAGRPVNPEGGAGAEPEKEEGPTDPERRPDRGRSVPPVHKARAFFKLAAKPDSAAPIKNRDLAIPSGQARRLLDFESHRLAGARLPDKGNPRYGHTGMQPGGDEADASLTIAGRDSPGGIRMATQILSQAGSNKFVPPPTEEVLTQIVDKAVLMVKANSSEMSIELKPEFLGKLSIKVMVEDGLVTARFLTDNHHVKQILESNLHTLRLNLESQGLKVDKTEVGVQLNNERSFDSPGNRGEDGWSGQQDAEGKLRLPERMAVPAIMDIPVRIAPGPEDNYLYGSGGQMSILV